MAMDAPFLSNSHFPCWGSLVELIELPEMLGLYNSSAVIQWLARKAKIPGLINQLWFVGNVCCRERWFFELHSLFIVVFIFPFLGINTSNKTACGLLPVFSYVHTLTLKEPFVFPAALFCMLQFQNLQTKFSWKSLTYFLLCVHVFWKVIKLTV